MVLVIKENSCKGGAGGLKEKLEARSPVHVHDV